MAIVNVPAKSKILRDASDVAGCLAAIGIEYERWETTESLAPDATDDEILSAYKPQIDKMMATGEYRTADVINVRPTTPALDEMLARFNKEHWHDEDEIRFIVGGRGIFHIVPENSDVVAVETEPGDLIRVPKGTRHWFDLCDDRTIRAIRLFQDVSGWTPHYTLSGIDGSYEPVCFGPNYFPSEARSDS